MTRLCQEPGCDNAISDRNTTGECGMCHDAKRKDSFAFCRRESNMFRRAADFLRDDTPPETVLRIATGVRV